MRKQVLALAGAATLLLSGLSLPAYAADNAQLSVLHGVPD